VSATEKPLFIRVDGVPAPGGSKRAFPHKATGKMMVVDAGGERTKEWREKVAQAGTWLVVSKELDQLTTDLTVHFRFVMPRPKYHFDSKGEIKPRYIDAQHTVRPDTTKLVRSTEDALTKIVWKDDAQITHQTACKEYADKGEQPHAEINIIF